jgi:uncharacterized protein RhaS with RHS repeats
MNAFARAISRSVFSSWFATVICLVSFGALLKPGIAVALPASCTTGSNVCTAPYITPWRYYTDPGFSHALRGPFESEAEAIQDLVTFPIGGDWCSSTFISVTYDDYTGNGPTGVTTTYIYNALGQRVKKSSPSSSRYFMYDEAGHLIGEYNSTGALIQETVWLGDIPVATLRPEGSTVIVYYVHTDHLNTPRRITRPSDNTIVWRWDSDPFGSDVANEDPDGDTAPFAYNPRFPGQYFDAESGVVYNYFRDYGPLHWPIPGVRSDRARWWDQYVRVRRGQSHWIR